MARAIVLSGQAAGCLRICVDGSCRDLRRGTSKEQAIVVQRPLVSIGKAEIQRAGMVLAPGGHTWSQEDGRAQMPVLCRRGLAPPLASLVRGGGIFIGICGGAFLGAHLPSFHLHPRVQTVHFSTFGSAQGYLEGQVRLSKAKGVPECFSASVGMLCRAPIYYENGPLLRCRESRRVRILALFSGRLKPCKKQPPHVRGKLRLQHGLGAVVACRVGKGCVLLLSPHPELTPGMRSVLGALWRAARQWCHR